MIFVDKTTRSIKIIISFSCFLDSELYLSSELCKYLLTINTFKNMSDYCKCLVAKIVSTDASSIDY